jgi:hypothetical protein
MWLRIQCNGVFKTLILTVCITSLTRRSSAQCTGVMQQQVYTYSLSHTGVGGNQYTVSVPQFNNVAGYTLTSVVFNSSATTSATFGLTNTLGTNQFVNANISRADFVQLGGSAVAYMSSTSYNGYAPVSVNTGTPPTNQYTYPSATIYNNQTLLNFSITNAATLLSTYTGAGNLTMYYNSQFYVNNVQSGVNSTLNDDDAITFSVTYNYCNTILATGFMNFTATRQGSSQVLLNWAVTNEQPGRIYYIQASTDGTNFVDAGSQPSQAIGSSASYSYTYSTPNDATGKLYFRIKQVDVNTGTSFSNVCVVNLDNSSNAGFSIFPNPATSGNFISLNLPGDSRSWQVQVFSADGNLIQSNAFSNLSLVTVNFNSNMVAGTYFVRAVNPLSGDVHTGSFLVKK